MSGVALRRHMGPVRSGVGNRVVWSYLDAPHAIERHPMVPEELLEERGRENCERGETSGQTLAWWRPSQRADGRWEFAGIGEGLKLLSDTLERHEEAPFDGVLGFSQGAGLLSLFVARQAALPAHRRSIRFACFVGGFQCAPAVPDLAHEYRGAPFDLPSLHVYGERDTIVKPRQGRKLEALFTTEGRTTVVHEGGHVVAADTASLRAYNMFFEERRREIVAESASRAQSDALLEAQLSLPDGLHGS
eukprot:scaffold160644_cov30-Tisochrysis_lutea.AAC.1